MEETVELRATATTVSEAAKTVASNPEPPRAPSKTREEGELSTSDDGDENRDSSAVQSIPAADSGLVQKSTLGIQGGSNNIQLQTTRQSTLQRSLVKKQLPPKSSTWNGHVGTNKNLVISFSDDDSGSDIETKGNASRLDNHIKRPISSFIKSNKFQLQQNNRGVHKAMPKNMSFNRTFIPSMTTIHGSNSKGAGSMPPGQGSLARNFNPMNRNLATQERGRDQGVRSKDNKLQDLRHQIALRESELKLKAALQNKDSASVLGRDHNAMNLKNDMARKHTQISAEAAQMEPKELDRKRLKLGTSHGTPPTIDSLQEVPASKSILQSKDSALEHRYPQDKNNVDHSQKETHSFRGESIVIRSQHSDKHLDNLVQNMPCRSRDISAEAAQMEPKEPDRKRLKLGTSHGTLHTTDSQQEVPASKSILPSKDSALEHCYPQDKNTVDHSQKETHLFRGESTVIRSQHSDKHLDNLVQHLPCRSRDGDVNYGCNLTENSSRLAGPCGAVDQSEVPAKMMTNSVPKNLEASTNGVLLNHNGNANGSEHNSIDLQSILDLEELIDKELEEAQEHRHKCEIEERNALKVYLKAQRSLLEANARCTNLYHKRELYSVKLRSLILNNSSFSWSSGHHQHVDIGLDYLPRHGYEIPTSSCQRQAEHNDISNPSFDSNNHGNNNGRSNTSDHHMTRANMVSEPCGELDASTSEPLPQRGNNAADGVYSPSDELDTSANDNEEMSPAGLVSNNLGAEYHSKQDTASNTKFSSDSPQDSLLLEAALRSKLFARLGARAIKSSSQCDNIEPATGQRTENECGSEKTQIHHGVVPLSGAVDDLKGIKRQERTISPDSNEIQSQQNIGGNSLNSNCSTGSRDQGDMPCQGFHSTNIMRIPPLVFRSPFSELREMSPLNSNQFESNKFIHDNDGENGKSKSTSLGSDETKLSDVLAISMPVIVGNSLLEESSYSCSSAVDPFWPLCMYELRGKCNNNECPWQHVKDYGDGKISQHQHTDYNNADCQSRLPLHPQNCNGVGKVLKCQEARILPTYLVGVDVLKADQLAYKPVVAHRNTPGWQKHFSITLATSNLLRICLPADGPLLNGGGERIEIQGAWSKELSPFQLRSGARNQSKQAMTDSEQAVEMALLTLDQEINKLQGIRKALSVLSKALETDPTSVILWIVYLLIYYGNLKPSEKDDMFFYAVKHCAGSYSLWLMYVNSQRLLVDRLAAYDDALSVLCQHASAAPKDRMHESACILDLFLQMLDCLCMSGNAEKAIQQAYGIPATTTKSNDPHHLSLSDILNCLTISDKCVFWVCCVYLVIYRKLPNAVVQKFECEKEILDIEWPCIRLSEDDREMAIKLVETAVESVDSYVHDEAMKSEVNLRSAQLFALNHIRCMVALDSLECLRNLLDKYIKLYPSSIELVLVSARIQKQEIIGVDSSMDFEEAISRWPKDLPGLQCMWNQYIENAIQNRRIDFAKEITDRWFHSVWQVQDLPNKGTDATGGGISCGSLGLNLESVSDTLTADLKQMDMMFGFLNLSIYKFFQNDVKEACTAVDKARSIAAFGGLERCMRKQMMFLLCDAFSLKEDCPNGAVKKILELYMDGSSQACLIPKALTRNFFDIIKKPRVRHLISNILSPISCDCSLLNLVLQSWIGSSLLSQIISDPKHLVDFVEAIMEVVPYNFQFVIFVCKLLRKRHNYSDLNSARLWFWACSTLVNAIIDAIPIPPEYAWVEAGEFLHNAMGIEAISERFYRRALSVYPFSIMLWKLFYKLKKTNGDPNDVIESAKERGIKLDEL